MHSYAVIPPMLLPADERKRRFINNNGLILDPLKEYEERKWVNMWTDDEKQNFREKFLQHPKNFGQIATCLERKTVSESVQFYYLSKKSENYKQLLRKSRVPSRRRRQQVTNNVNNQNSNNSDVMTNNIGVVTRNTSRNTPSSSINHPSAVNSVKDENVDQRYKIYATF